MLKENKLSFIIVGFVGFAGFYRCNETRGF